MGLGLDNSLRRNAGSGFVTAIVLLVPVAVWAQFVDVTSGPLGDVGAGFGVASGDYDNDGDLDLYVANMGTANVLLRNDGGGTFVNATSGPLGDTGPSISVAWGDYDNDGDLDLYVSNTEADNRLLRNEGGGAFVDMTSTPLGGGSRTAGIAWADYDNDSDLDLYVGSSSWGSALFRNDGDGEFTDAISGGLGGACVTWGDCDDDGDLDLYLVQYGSANRLFRNDGAGVFVDITSGPLGDPGNGAGAAWGDYDNDGDLDIYFANHGEANKLLRNDGGGSFTDVTSGPLGDLGGGTGVAWADYDNDGDLDLYLSNFGQANKLLRNDGGGAFTDATSGPLGDEGWGQGVVWIDFDNDGDQDLYLANNGQPNRLFRNDVANGNHWLRVKLEGRQSNAGGVGARVQVVTSAGSQIRELSGGSNFGCQDARLAAFGLGSSNTLRSLTVTWPSGIVQIVDPPPSVDAEITVVESGAMTNRVVIEAPTAETVGVYRTSPGQLGLQWNYAGPDEPSMWNFWLSFDGGRRFYQIDRATNGTTRVHALPIPPVSTHEARVRIEALAEDYSVLATVDADFDIVFINESRVYFDAPYYDFDEYETVSGPGIVVEFDGLSPGVQYAVKIEQVYQNDSPPGPTTCADPSVKTAELVVPVAAGSSVGVWSVNDEDLELLPAAWYKARLVDAASPSITISQKSLLLCRAEDLISGVEHQKPVLLVHGWTKDSTIWEADEIGITLAENGYRPITFAYPNIGDVQLSGAALGEVIDFLLALSDEQKVDIIAHSLGGLVSRSYLQGLALTHNESGSTQTYAYRHDVASLITLATPHLGVVAEWIGGLAKELGADGYCDGAAAGEATKQAARDSDLMGELSAPENSMPCDVEYFFTAGLTWDANRTLRRTSYLLADSGCGKGNDSVVSTCSAFAGHVTGDDYQAIPLCSQNTYVLGYELGHDEMALPRHTFEGDIERTLESTILMVDILGFLGGNLQVPPLGTPKLNVLGDGSSVNVSVYGTATGIRTGLLDRIGPVETERWPREAESITASTSPAGAEIVVRDPGQVMGGGGTVYGTDPNGVAQLQLRPGNYKVEVRTDGYAPRIEQLLVPENATNYDWDLTLEEVPSTLSAPSLLLDAGASTSADSSVTVTLSCAGATEYELSSDPYFDGTNWTPMATSVPWTIGTREGLHVVYARFRDGSGNISIVVEDRIYKSGARVGSIYVTSSISGAGIILNGEVTGLTAPATINALPPGIHVVALDASGYSSDPVMHGVTVTAGGTSAADFVLSLAPPPPAADANSIAGGLYLAGEPFQWTPPTGWDPTSPLFYDIRVSSDAAQDNAVFVRTSVASPEIALQSALPDSQEYFVSLTSRDIRGAVQSETPNVRSFFLDHTPPSLSVLSPAPDDTVYPGDPMSLVTQATDWSGIDAFDAYFSPDDGAAYPDTLWSGSWLSPVDVTVPQYGLADRALILISATDLAGNIGTAVMDSTFVVSDGITAVGESDGTTRRFGLAISGTNPTSSSSHFAITVPSGSRAKVSIYDARGRRVKTVFSGEVPSGGAAVMWDGRDDRGSRVATGIYFVALENRGQVSLRKIAIVR